MITDYKKLLTDYWKIESTYIENGITHYDLVVKVSEDELFELIKSRREGRGLKEEDK